MAKKIICTVVWTVVFFIGSATLFDYFSSVFSLGLHHPGEAHFGETISLVDIAYLVVPLICCALGLLLSILGKLPGTRRQLSK
jgi:hypothetical protein